ncbi:putative HTH-type transcriptional regulator MsmR [Alicyclobacillus hesperidum subsp. aegles]|nr:putative HTH-type transcriptional regulator MsmR [Alicyclobacillus hesperidum subsp. aegles]
MATMKDVANAAHVSIAVVSRVLNGDSTLSVPDSTRQRVIETAKKLNYTLKHRRLKTKQNVTKILLADYHCEEEERDDPYFWPMIRGIEMECQVMGIEPPTKRYLSPGTCLDNETLEEYDGVLVIGGEATRNWNNHPQKLVFLDYCPDTSKFPSVSVDFRGAVFAALRHLQSLGCADIAYIGGTRHFGIDYREAAFTEYMQQHTNYAADSIFHGDWSTAGGYEAMCALLEKRQVPQAVFVASDPMAIGAIRAMSEVGLRVPEDVAVVGFDDIEMAPYVTPSLTTIRVNPELMGRLGVRMLVNPLEQSTPLQVVMPFQLIVRESCGSETHRQASSLPV